MEAGVCVCGCLNGLNLLIMQLLPAPPTLAAFSASVPVSGKLVGREGVSCERGLPGSFLNLYWQEYEQTRQGAPGAHCPQRCPGPDLRDPVDIASCPFARGHWQKPSNTTGHVSLLCVGLWASFPTGEEGEGCREVVVLLSLGAIGCLFRDHAMTGGPVPARHQATQSVCQGFPDPWAVQTKLCQGRLPILPSAPDLGGD